MAEKRYALAATRDRRGWRFSFALSAEGRAKTPPLAARPVGGVAKRGLDIVVALLTLVAATPVMAMVFILIKASDGGPALYSQHRVGFDGRTFRCWKFRTMVVDADARLSAYLAQNAEAAQQWERARKLETDPRITLAGRWLRRSSLDELPQLFNVLAGDMSCVGPRPVVPQELAKYGRAAADYLRARPASPGCGKSPAAHVCPMKIASRSTSTMCGGARYGSTSRSWRAPCRR